MLCSLSFLLISCSGTGILNEPTNADAVPKRVKLVTLEEMQDLPFGCRIKMKIKSGIVQKVIFQEVTTEDITSDSLPYIMWASHRKGIVNMAPIQDVEYVAKVNSHNENASNIFEVVYNAIDTFFQIF